MNIERYLKVPVEFGKTRTGKMWCQLHDIYEEYSRRSIQPFRGRGSTEEEAFANLLAKLGYEEAKSPTMSDKMRDVARWFDQLHNADHPTESISGELYAWAKSIETCEGKGGE